MMIRRRAYSYVRNGKVVHVKSTLYRRGVGFKGPGKGIGSLKKGLLGRYGYYDVKNMSERSRMSALRRAERALGRTHVKRSLIAASTYTKRTSPKSSRIFRHNASRI